MPMWRNLDVDSDVSIDEFQMPFNIPAKTTQSHFACFYFQFKCSSSLNPFGFFFSFLVLE
jgi:hypothetical protein